MTAPTSPIEYPLMALDPIENNMKKGDLLTALWAAVARRERETKR